MTQEESQMNISNPDTTVEPQADSEAPNDSSVDSATTAEDSTPPNAPDNVCEIPVVSDAKLKANRRNACKSTGPKTQEGKGKSRGNAVRHGMKATTLLLDGTLDANAESVLAALQAEHSPEDVAERLALENLALVILRMRRQSKLEREALEHPHAFEANGSGRLVQFIANNQKHLLSARADWLEMLSAAQQAKEKGDEDCEPAS